MNIKDIKPESLKDPIAAIDILEKMSEDARAVKKILQHFQTEDNVAQLPITGKVYNLGTDMNDVLSSLWLHAETIADDCVILADAIANCTPGMSEVLADARKAAEEE